MTLTSTLRSVAFASLAALSCTLVAAQAFPNKPVRFIVPYAPGGASDALARMLGVAVAADLGQSVVVDNRPGGASVVGTQAVATALSNGYTVGVVDSAYTINPALLREKLPYDTLKDFSPVIMLGTAPIVLAVNASLKVSNLKELIALAKAKAGSLNYSSAGNGTALHLAGEQLKLAAGIDMAHVPYKGGAPSVMAVVAGETQVTLSAPSTVMAHIQSGRLRAIAITGTARLPALPGVATFAEQGLAGVDGLIAFGVVGPRGLPPEVVTRLARALDKQLATHEIRQKMMELGFQPVGGSPDDYAKFIALEVPKWIDVVQRANIKLDF